jgi:hypothetical protein
MASTPAEDDRKNGSHDDTPRDPSRVEEPLPET